MYYYKAQKPISPVNLLRDFMKLTNLYLNDFQRNGKDKNIPVSLYMSFAIWSHQNPLWQSEHQLDGITPPSILMNAKGFAISSVIKAGFVLSTQVGSGVVTAKFDDESMGNTSGVDGTVYTWPQKVTVDWPFPCQIDDIDEVIAHKWLVRFLRLKMLWNKVMIFYKIW